MRGWLLVLALSVAGFAVIATGCGSTSPRTPGGPLSPPIEQGVDLLLRPLPGPMAALYRMQVKSSGGFRLSVAAVEGGTGRITVSEPFGAAVVLAGWEASTAAEVFDLREGCRLAGGAMAEGFALEGLPLRRIHRLLGGRLPALDGDPVVFVDDRIVQISTDRGFVTATLARNPWRVVTVVGDGFSVALDMHTSSLPGRLRFESASGEAAELELVRLQWEHTGDWAPMPELPACGPS